MTTLYVAEQGARLEKEYRRFIVTLEDQVLAAVPAARVSHVVLVGNVGVTTPALTALLQQDASLSLLSRGGELRGRLAPPTGGNVALRHRQYERAQDPGFCLSVSAALVGGKLRNSLALARRMARGRPSLDAEPLDRLAHAVRQLAGAPDLGRLRGLEGQGARAYFAVLRQALKPGLGFERRTRRPPRDPLNALLSLGYTLLTDNLVSACEIVGLDPYDGFYHADKYGRPALALDLVEEFRAVIVDSVVLNVVNRGVLVEDDFEPGESGATWLKPAALRRFFRCYGARINTAVRHPLADRPLTYQKIFEVQARLLRQAIEGHAAAYTPFSTK